MGSEKKAITAKTLKKYSQTKEVWRRFKKNKLALGGLTTILFIILMVIMADVLSSYQKAITMDIPNMLQPPNSEHIFGTDGYGRDLFARCLYGGRVSLLISLTAAISGVTIGGIFGVIAGYSNEIADNIIMRFMDIISAIPATLLALSVVAALGPSIPNLIIALVCSRIPIFTRVIRSSVLGTVNQEYLEAARAGGTSVFRIMYKQILPNVFGTMIVQTTMQISVLILETAGLSFLGLGVTAPQPEWGALISEAKEYMRTSPYLIIIPGMIILISSLAISLMGDGLRDALDPRLKT